jgi:hypothetical protein
VASYNILEAGYITQRKTANIPEAGLLTHNTAVNISKAEKLHIAQQ